jgi:hypothetical protein
LAPRSASRSAPRSASRSAPYAALCTRGARLPRCAARFGRPRSAAAVLDRVHSGHIGDYVAWLLFGLGALTALLGPPLL